MKDLSSKIKVPKEATRTQTGSFKYDARYDEALELLGKGTYCPLCFADLPPSHPFYEKPL